MTRMQRPLQHIQPGLVDSEQNDLRSILYCNEDTREIYLDKEIDTDICTRICAFMRYLDSMGARWNSYLPITLFINSPGGSTRDTFAIIDCMGGLESPVITHAEGMAYSGAALILMAGEEGGRFVSRNALVMLHELSGGVTGTYSQINDHRLSLDKEMEIIVEHVAKCTGQRRDKVKKDLSRDVYMSAEEVVKYGKRGIADAILPDLTQKEKEKNE